MKTVRFLKLTYVEERQYLPGQAHEFEDSVADGLIKDGLAQDPDKPVSKEEKPKSDPKKQKK